MRDLLLIYKDYTAHLNQVPDDHKIDLDKMEKIFDNRIADGTFTEETKTDYRHILNQCLPDKSKLIDLEDFIVLDLEGKFFDTYKKPFGTEV